MKLKTWSGQYNQALTFMWGFDLSIKYRKIDHSWVSNEKDKNVLCIDIHVYLAEEKL